jgi:group I intron endonuclease
MIIYQIINLITQDSYVGQTIQKINNRFSNHKSYARNGCKTHLCNAIRKYGEENFIINVLEEDIYDRKNLNEKEKIYIEKLNPKYNMTKGGDGVSGIKHTEKTKLKISQTHKNRTPWNKGLKLSEETKNKMSQSRKGRTFSEEHKKNLSISKKGKNHHLYGKKLSTEHKLKISNSLKKEII